MRLPRESRCVRILSSFSPAIGRLFGVGALLCVRRPHRFVNFFCTCPFRSYSYYLPYWCYYSVYYSALVFSTPGGPSLVQIPLATQSECGRTSIGSGSNQAKRLAVDLDPRPGARRENHSRRRVFVSASEQNFVRASVQHARDRPKLVAADISIDRHVRHIAPQIPGCSACRSQGDRSSTGNAAARAHISGVSQIVRLPPDETRPRSARHAAPVPLIRIAQYQLSAELLRRLGSVPSAMRSATCSSLIMARPFYRQANQTKRPGRATTG